MWASTSSILSRGEGGGAWRTGGASPIAKASASLPPPSARDSPLCDGAARCSMLRSRRSPLAITVQNGHLRCEPLWPRTSQCAWWCTEGRGQKTFVQREFACAKSHRRCDVTWRRNLRSGRWWLVRGTRCRNPAHSRPARLPLEALEIDRELLYRLGSLVGVLIETFENDRVELPSGGWIAFVEIGDRFDDVRDRLLRVGDFQRPRAASMISRARFESTKRP